METSETVVRGAAAVREAMAEEHLKMQRRAYRRVRPYLVGALTRLRRAYPGFQTVVFGAEKAAFVLVFGDGTFHHEAPKAFAGLKSACEDLARLSEIEWLTASDPIWQVRQDGQVLKPSEIVVQQYHYIEKDGWTFWMRRPLREARYYIRQAIFSRVFYGAQRAGFGKRIVTEGGAVIDEWVDPLETTVLRVFRERGVPISLYPLCSVLHKTAKHNRGTDDSDFYIWDVQKACKRLVVAGSLRQINPKASEGSERFVLAEKRS
jgi:hypothetical protein